MFGAIVPRAVDALDPDELIERLDLNAVLARIDLDVLLERLDLDAVLAKVDLDALMTKIDVDALISRVDINYLVSQVDVNDIVSRVDIDGLMTKVDIDGLMSRVDVGALVSRVDVNGIVADVDVNALVQQVDVDAMVQRIDVPALVERVDVNSLVDEVDIPALVSRAGIDQIVSDATSGIATRALDLARRQVLGFDLLALRLVDRVLRRSPQTTAAVEPWPAGPLSRLLAFTVDSVTISALFGLGVSLGGFLLELFTNHTFDGADSHGTLWLAAYAGWWFTYMWAGILVSGRTLGKGLLGLRVLALDGGPLSAGGAARRALALPFSLILGLGLLPAVFGRSRRAAHDYVAGSREVVDWGAREVEPPARMADFMSREPAEAA